MMVNLGEGPSNNAAAPGANTAPRPSSISGIDAVDTTSNSGGYDGASGGGNSIANGQGGDPQRKNEDKRVPYTMPGVLHYLQYEWSRIELERTQWEMERAELKARISFLQGERKGQENLKRDLVRRIKMLEYSLKQERVKLHRLTHNGDDPEPVEEEEKPEFSEVISDVPLDVDAYTNSNELPSWKRARQQLKQYLEEMGYSDGIINVRAFRSSKLMGNNAAAAAAPSELTSEDSRKVFDQTEKEILETADFLQKYNLKEFTDADDDVTEHGQIFDDDAVDALQNFSFLDQEKTSTTRKTPKNSTRTSSGDDWGIDEKTFNRMREDYRQEQKKRLQSSFSSGSVNQENEKQSADLLPPGGNNLSGSRDSGIMQEMFEQAYAAGGGDTNEEVDIKDDFAVGEDDVSLAVRWNLKYTLRSHYDAVRAIQFHPVEPVLITASEDGTAKLWNLAENKANEPQKGAQITGAAGIMDVEPVYTFRGHKSAILSIDMSPTGDQLYTAGLDGVICCWQVPSINIDVHGLYDPSVLLMTLRGHTDAIWSVNYHSSTNRLLSASADGTIKVWDLSTSDESEYLLRTIENNDLIPRSLDIVSTEPTQIVVAYTGGTAAIIDIETGSVVLNFEFPANEEVGEINKILSHPTMPVTVLAGDDRKIRYFDNNSGKLIYGAVAHVEAISTLAIDPNGLYLMSGSHDGSLRIWNMEQRKCLQEIAAHRKKFDMSVLAVAFHPSRPLIGSAGADSLVKIFTSQRITPSSPQVAAGGDEDTPLN
uniref:Striatin domain-containing protein n=1 Tax=Panagrellus redivivus TaxID=6233 RepID=A0A7E4W249_PANRE